MLEFQFCIGRAKEKQLYIVENVVIFSRHVADNEANYRITYSFAYYISNHLFTVHFCCALPIRLHQKNLTSDSINFSFGTVLKMADFF